MSGRRVLRRLLGSGDYQLVLFDVGRDKQDLRPRCTPFSFRLILDREIEAESFLSCKAASIPTTFDAPGFLTHDGRLIVNNDFVLDGQVKVLFSCVLMLLIRANLTSSACYSRTTSRLR